MLVSLFVSFSLDPMLSAYWSDPHLEEHQKSWLTKQLDKFNHWFNGLAAGYRRLVGWALDHPKSMVLLAATSFIFALAMPAMGLVGGGFFPIEDNAELQANVESPPGANLDYLRQKVNETLAIASKYPEVRYSFVTAGGAAAPWMSRACISSSRPGRAQAAASGMQTLAAVLRET